MPFEIDIVIQICLKSIETDRAVVVWRISRLEAFNQEGILRIKRSELCHVLEKVKGASWFELEECLAVIVAEILVIFVIVEVVFLGCRS